MSTSIFNISFLKNIYSLVSHIKKNEKSNSYNVQILEPLTTIISLAIISFKKIGTKIAVYSNKIYIQSPNLTQGAVRWTYGINREEIHFLLKPILRAVQIYDPKTNDNIKLLFQNAISGIKLLKQSYNNSSSTLCHTLDLYTSIISNSIKTDNLESSVYIDNICNNLNISLNTKLNLHNLFKGIWKDEEINLISLMFKLANSDNSDQKKSYIVAIESIVSTKEEYINKIIENTNKLLL